MPRKHDSIKKPGEKGLRKEHLCYKFMGSWLPGANHATLRMNYKNENSDPGRCA